MYNFVNVANTSKNTTNTPTEFRNDTDSELFNCSKLLQTHYNSHENAIQPTIKILSYVLQELRGLRPNGLEGAIINFNAKNTFNAKDPADLEWGAHRLLEDAEVSGVHYATISRSGTIYVPSYWNWLDYGLYAEGSQCPVTKRKDVSQYYVGLEINSPGFAYPTDKENQFIAWYDAKKDTQGQIILQNGLATPLHSNVEFYNISEVWDISEMHGSDTPLYFIPYTPAQQRTLINMLQCLKSFYPKSFRYDYVFGYDEISQKDERIGRCSGVTNELNPTPEAKTMSQLRAYMTSFH